MNLILVDILLMSPLNEELEILLTDLRDFCDKVYLKYSNFRTKLQVSKDNFPAYELSRLYYEIAALWFECSGDKYLSLRICKNYLSKCIDVFYDNQTIDISIKAKILLAKVLDLIKSKSNEIIKLEELLKDKNNDRECIRLNVLKTCENYILIGNFKKSGDYLTYFNKILGSDEEAALKHARKFSELTVLRSLGETVQSLLDLQESLLFIDEDNHTEIEFGFKKNENELKNTLRTWKMNCNELNKNGSVCKLKFINEVDEKMLNKDKVRSGKEIFIISNSLKKYSIGFFNKNSKAYDKVEIKDKTLFEMLSNRNFTNSISKNLIDRVNIILNKIGSEYFLNKALKNKILILANQNEVSFYLYLCLVNSTDEKANVRIIGDLIFPSDKNKNTLKLWTFLFKIFTNEIKIGENEFIHNLINEYHAVFNGRLVSKIPMLQNERYENIYHQLSIAYDILGHRSLANEYKNLVKPKRKEVLMSINDAKSELMEKQIVCETGLILPGDHYLNKSIRETDFFSIILPKLNEIGSLKKFLHPCLKVIPVSSSMMIPNRANWFGEESFRRFYDKCQKEARATCGNLLKVCLLIYFNKEKMWGLMFGISDGLEDKMSGLLSELSEIKKFKKELKTVFCLLINIKRKVDFYTENKSMSILHPKTKKFENSLVQIEQIMNSILQNHYMHDRNNIYDNQVLNNQIGDESTNKNVFDITSIGGILELKLAVKSAREGYYVLIRKTEDNHDYYCKNFSNTVQITKINTEYHVYGKLKSCEWTTTKINADKNKLDLIETFFKKLSFGNQKKVFISPIKNAVLYYFLQDFCVDNSNWTTKTLSEDSFFTLIKCGEDHYVSLAVIKANINDSNEYTIFQADPLNTMINYVEFLEGTGKNFKYRFRPEIGFIQCQNSKYLENTLIKSHFALKAIQYLWRKGKDNWLFGFDYFKYQSLCSEKNVEIVKKWFLNSAISDEMKNDQVVNQSYALTGLSFFDNILIKFDKTFICSLNKNIDETHDTENQFIVLLRKVDLFNKVQKFKIENTISHEIHQNIMSMKNSININKMRLFETVDDIVLLDELKKLIEKRQNSTPNAFFVQLLDQIQTNIQNSDRSIGDLRNYLKNLLFTEKSEIIIQMLNEVQFELNKSIRNIFDEALKNILTNNKSKNSFSAINDLVSSKNFTGFNDFMKIIANLVSLNTGPDNSELQNLYESWLKMEGIFKMKEQEKMKGVLENNYYCILYKISLFSLLIEPYKNFTKTFVSKILDEYENQDLQDIFKLIYNNIEIKLRDDEEFIKEIPAFKEADELIQKSKQISIINFINHPQNATTCINIVSENNQNKILVKQKDEDIAKTFKIENDRISGLVRKYYQNLDEFLFNESSLSEFTKYLEIDLKLNINELILENEYHSSNFISKIGEDIIRNTAICLCVELPKFILSFRETSVKLSEIFYVSLYESFIQDFEILNQSFSFIFSTELQSEISSNDFKSVFIQEIEKGNFKVVFYSKNENKTIKKSFKNYKIFGLFGKVSLEDYLETEILNSIDYFKYNTLQESLVNKCIQIFKTGHNQCEILVRIASILNLTKLEALSDMLPEMEKNKCGTKVFFIEYYSMIENLVKSFEKVNFVLTEIKNSLWNALLERFEMLPDEILVSTLKSEVLDKISAKTQISQVLSCFSGLKFNNRIQDILNDLEDTFENRNDLKGKYACCSLIQRFIINLVEKFTDSIL